MSSMMQSDGAGDMDMDELFDRHLEQNEGEGVDGFEEDDLAPSDGGHGGPYRGGAPFDELDEDGDDDASMEDLEEYSNAEYIPGSSFQPHSSTFGASCSSGRPSPGASAAGGSPGGGGGAPLGGGLGGAPDPFGGVAPGGGASGPWEPGGAPPGLGRGALHVDEMQHKGLKRAASSELPPGSLPASSLGRSGDSGDSGGFRAPCVSDFKTIRVIGKGSFGKVFLVRHVRAGTIFAMKVLKKENIVKRNQVEHTKTERSVLAYVRHPFVVGLHSAFQTAEKLFFVLDYCAGGELFCHLQKLGKFAEPRARFYTAELVLALAHVHALGVVYRDLKPENVLLDARGHVRLTDFGLSKEGVTAHAKGAHSFCGTPEYLAPEILARRGHGRAVDWWSLGALLYEMLTGLPPFYSRDREKLFEGIKSGDLSYPAYLSGDARGLLAALLHRDPAERLGSGPGDADEIKAHAFFARVDWDALLDGAVAPPWQPQVVGSLDTSQFDREFTSLPIHSPPSRTAAARYDGGSDDQTFAGFTYAPRRQLHPSARGPGKQSKR
ncbi:hypothetical protein AURANDRAFT_36757 [Aureococcus anophagefferens]|uniref:Protein kinase domain-containing protein n=1 Tax=Aureococcus anophagefferens TaxID=44056 RepID=F0Y4C2_AURAN|nr:hypothetical protein AURANDRAFT_36757 [Aureococcus anophagefferens]EGB10420.1 hypothetical protein AURANDRAFT_36757 [Aureococcus anophagefferens]|eukprot:XP_009035219.1 hypothetical protein AURANDRAFT_36757 [Aureococcus anophagefferens]